VIYTQIEWDTLRAEGGRFAGTIESQAIWIWDGNAAAGAES
jgi:hypothetical protein